MSGNIVATKLRHLKAQATEPLRSSGDGQHGMSALLGIATLTGVIETPAPPVTGAKTTEMAMRTASNVRAPIITQTIGRCKVAGQLPRTFL